MKPRAALASLAVLFALPALAQKPDVRLDVGRAPGSAASSAVQIAAAGSSVFVVWHDSRNQGVNAIYSNRSSDNGATWLAADVRLDVGKPAGSSSSDLPHVAVAGSSVFVVWEDGRGGGGRDIYCNRSLDGGASWLPADVRLDTGDAPGSAHSFGPRVAVSGSTVCVVWCDRRNGNYDVYCNRSADNGNTWLPVPVRLDTGDAPGAFDSLGVQIAAEGSSFYVVWLDQRSSPSNADVHANVSFDSGANWLPADIQLDTGTAPGAVDSLEPRIAAAGTSVYVTWYDMTAAGPRVQFNCSVDRGASWLPAELRLGSATAAALSPCVAASGSSAYVAWYDYRNGSAAADIWCNRTTDGGQTWLPGDVRLDTGSPPATHASFNPRIAAAGPIVEVAWEEHRGTNQPRIWSNRSLDGGVTWLGTDVRLDRGNGPTIGGAFAPQVAVSDASAFAVWLDNRNASGTDVWFALASGFQRYGTGTAGTGAFTPALSASGNACVGGAMSLDFTAGRGAAPGLLAIGLGPASKIAQPFFGGTLLVQPGATSFLVLGGLAGAPGGGSYSLLVPVPVNFLLLGLDANFQGLFLDNAAVQGVSMSNAVEAWIG